MSLLAGLVSGLGIDPKNIDDAIKGLSEAFKRLERIEAKLDVLIGMKGAPNERNDATEC